MNLNNKQLYSIFINEKGNLIKSHLKSEWLKKYYPEIKNQLDSIYKDSYSYSEKIYRIINNIAEKPVCKICGKLLAYHDFKTGFGIYCSVSCKNKDNEVSNYKSTGQITDDIIIKNLFIDNKVSNRRIWVKWLKEHGFYDYLINRFKDSQSLLETLYRIYNKIEQRPVCKVCGKPVSFLSMSKGFARHCSKNCASAEKSPYNILPEPFIDDEIIIKELIEDRQLNASKIKEKWLKEHGFYDYLINRFKDSTGVNETVYRIYSKTYARPVCEQCGNRLKYYGFSLGFHKNKSGHYLCLSCSQKITIIENKIEGFLRQYKLKYFKNYRQAIYPLELDFYLPDFNIGIECNGIYWHRGISGRSRLKIKYKACMDKGIKLIVLWENEINENFDLISAYLKDNLKINSQILYSDCNIIKITNDIIFSDYFCINDFKKKVSCHFDFTYSLVFNGQIAMLFRLNKITNNKYKLYIFKKFNCSIYDINYKSVLSYIKNDINCNKIEINGNCDIFDQRLIENCCRIKILPSERSVYKGNVYYNSQNIKALFSDK